MRAPLAQAKNQKKARPRSLDGAWLPADRRMGTSGPFAKARHVTTPNRRITGRVTRPATPIPARKAPYSTAQAPCSLGTIGRPMLPTPTAPLVAADVAQRL